MTRCLVALICGVIFGVGLAVSQMINPSKVLGFLDVTGEWDISLAFVMIGALVVATPAFWFVLRRPKPLCAEAYNITSLKEIDIKLVFGAAIFGIGWGLAGYCPGPAIAAFALMLRWDFYEPLIFTGGMIAGMLVYHIVDAKK